MQYDKEPIKEIKTHARRHYNPHFSFIKDAQSVQEKFPIQPPDATGTLEKHWMLLRHYCPELHCTAAYLPSSRITPTKSVKDKNTLA